jgi:hypothetical protein
MKLETLQYKSNGGWSAPTFPDLDSKSTLIIVFASPNFGTSSQPLQELAQHYPLSSMIGCSTAGEIFGSHILDDSLSIAILCFENTSIKVIKTSLNNMGSSLDAGKNIAQQLNADDLAAIFVLSDGLNVNGTQLVNGLNQEVSENVIITGGLAGDGKNFKKTWVIMSGEICQNSAVAVGFYGEHVHVGHASRGGWDIFGPERIVTLSNANVLYELDGKPALELYKEYLGDRALDLPSSGLLFPLAIRKDDNDYKPLVRTILAVDEKKQSLIFAGDIPEGYLAQLMRANFERLISSASETADVALKVMLQGQNKAIGPMLAIAISCVGRRLLLGERTEEETESLLEALPAGTLQIGFYSYGELSPYTAGSCDLHNQTMTLTTLYEY